MVLDYFESNLITMTYPFPSSGHQRIGIHRLR
jgi:hypothetical protein